jgi:hypothetical protein
MSEDHDWLADLTDDGLRLIWKCDRCGSKQFRTNCTSPPSDALIKVDVGGLGAGRFLHMTCNEFTVHQVHDL